MIRVRIGLDGGDNRQFARADYFLMDNSIGAEVAAYRVAEDDWIKNGTQVFGDTLTAHVGGSFDLVLFIDNTQDSQGQCFTIFARGAYM